MVSVGGTAASTHQEKNKDNMKLLSLVDIFNQYYYIYDIIINSFCIC